MSYLRIARANQNIAAHDTSFLYQGNANYRYSLASKKRSEHTFVLDLVNYFYLFCFTRFKLFACGG